MKFIYLITVFYLILIMQTSCKSTYNTAGMFQQLTDSIMTPRVNNLELSLNKLIERTENISVLNSSEEIDEMITLWKQTIMAWKKNESFYVGYLKISYTAPDMYFYPNVSKINSYLENTDTLLNPRFIEQLGSSEKGLLTLGYLLQNYRHDISNNKNIQDYITVIGRLLKENSIEYFTAWDKQKKALHAIGKENTKYSTNEKAIMAYINHLISLTEDYRDTYLGNILGTHDNKRLHPELQEIPYGSYSKETFYIAITSLEEFIMGKPEGFDDLLRYHGGTKTTEELKQHFTILKKSIEELPHNFKDLQQNHVKFQRVYDNCTSLLKCIQTQIAPRLNITVTFSDNDGD